MLWNLLGLFLLGLFLSLFEDITITTNFLKSYIYSKSCIEINTLFATLKNKKLGNFRVRPTYSLLKGMVMVNGKLFQV